MSAARIGAARSAGDITEARRLFLAYAHSLPIDLAYQNFEAELAALPGAYAPPRGELLLARDMRGVATGCVALRPLEYGVCEMKRLYVAPAGRGAGRGRALAREIVAVGRKLGYREMRLDTLTTMAEALALYRSLGFAEIAPYYDSPVAGTIFMALRLA